MAEASLSKQRIRMLVVLGLVFGLIATPIVYALTNDAPVDQGVTVAAVNGPQVTIGEATQADLSNLSASATETRVVSDAGNVTVGGPDDGAVRVDDFAGTFVNVSNADSAGGTLTVDPDTKPAADLSGQFQSFAWRDPTIADGTVDFTYASQNEVTVALPHGTSGQYAAVAGGQVLDGEQSADSTITFTLPAGSYDVQIQKQDGAPSLSSGSPTGRINQSQPTLSVAVDDPDFSAANSTDAVTVTFSHDGTQVHQETVTSAGTVSYTLDSITFGSHSWSVTATDAYGASTTNSYSYNVGGELQLYNASAPATLVTKQTDVTFYTGDEQVLSRTTSDGTIDLGTLPAAPEDGYEISVEPESNYSARRLVIPDLVGQSEVYLLPTSADTVDVEFRIQDFTGGNYAPEDTRLFVKRPIRKDFDGDGNQTTRYQIVTASTFDVAGGYPTTLVRDQRYRLRIENRDGDVRVVGTYTVSTSEIVPITVKGLEFDPPEGQSWATNLTSTDSSVTWKYMDPSGETSELNVTIENESGGVVYQDSATGSIQNYSAYQIPINNSTSYTLSWNATRGSQSIGQTRPVRGSGPLVSIPFDSDWLGTFGLLMVVFVLSLADVRKTSYVAMSAVAVAGMLMAIQAVNIFPPLWFAGALIAVGTHLRTIQTRQ